MLTVIHLRLKWSVFNWGQNQVQFFQIWSFLFVHWKKKHRWDQTVRKNFDGKLCQKVNFWTPISSSTQSLQRWTHIIGRNLKKINDNSMIFNKMMRWMNFISVIAILNLDHKKKLECVKMTTTELCKLIIMRQEKRCSKCYLLLRQSAIHFVYGNMNKICWYMHIKATLKWNWNRRHSYNSGVSGQVIH